MVLFKFLLILILIIYVFYKAAGFLFRLVFGGFRNDPGHFRSENTRRASNGNLRVDKIPHSKRDRSKNDFSGGEYVDYEEVK